MSESQTMTAARHALTPDPSPTPGRRGGLTRRVFKFGVFLLLGAIINVTVASISSARMSHPTVSETTATEFAPLINGQWNAPRDRDRYLNTTHHRAFGTEWRSYWLCEGSAERQVAWRVEGMGIEFIAGWPAPALVGAIIRGDNSKAKYVALIRGQYPTRPLWPGFAINTIFYAGILWLLFAAPGITRKLRRQRRIKRGLCPACSYPVGSSNVCTECGKSIPAMTPVADKTPA